MDSCDLKLTWRNFLKLGLKSLIYKNYQTWPVGYFKTLKLAKSSKISNIFDFKMFSSEIYFFPVKTQSFCLNAPIGVDFIECCAYGTNTAPRFWFCDVRVWQRCRAWFERAISIKNTPLLTLRKSTPDVNYLKID